MYSQNIFIGTIKKCKNVYWYEKYGEEHIIGDFQIGHCEVGTIHKYVDTINDHAVLIKVDESKYIWVDLLTNKIEELLVNIGIPINAISTVPLYDGELFVDEKTLVPVFEENYNLNVNKVKSLVRTSKK